MKYQRNGNDKLDQRNPFATMARIRLKSLLWRLRPVTVSLLRQARKVVGVAAALIGLINKASSHGSVLSPFEQHRKSKYLTHSLAITSELWQRLATCPLAAPKVCQSAARLRTRVGEPTVPPSL